MANPQTEICIMCEKTAEELGGLTFVRFEGTGFLLCCLCHEELCKKEYFNIFREFDVKPKERKKEKIPYLIRIQVYERDEYRCVYCGGYKDLTLDHKYPEALGGKATIDNLVTCCRSCNSKKGTKVEGDANGEPSA